MSNDTLWLAVVQSVFVAIQQALAPMAAELPPEVLLNRLDRHIGQSVVEGARLALEFLLSKSKPEAHGCEPSQPRLRHYQVHTAVGRVAFERACGIGQDGGWIEPIPPESFPHGCTESVREECAWYLAQGTAAEAHEGMQRYRQSVPSESTIQRVAAREGVALMKIWDEQTPALTQAAVAPVIAETVLVCVSSDGANVPMRGAGKLAAREYHEARVVTVSLFGEPNPERERTLTLHTLEGEPYRECVGYQRPLLATIVFGEMPTLQGPKGERASRALTTVLDQIRSMQPEVQVQGVCDGGAWPEATVDAAVGSEHRGTDFGHAMQHLHAAADAAFGEGEFSTAWYRQQRSKLLTEEGAVSLLVAELERLASRPGLRTLARKRLKTEAGFFRKRTKHMNYAERLFDNLLIGSGIVEASVKRLFTLRMKRTGATWTEEGGDAVIALRSLRLSGMWNHAWQLRINQERRSYRRYAA